MLLIYVVATWISRAVFVGFVQCDFCGHEPRNVCKIDKCTRHSSSSLIYEHSECVPMVMKASQQSRVATSTYNSSHRIIWQPNLPVGCRSESYARIVININRIFFWQVSLRKKIIVVYAANNKLRRRWASLLYEVHFKTGPHNYECR